jgi:hypothetical protein
MFGLTVYYDSVVVPYQEYRFRSLMERKLFTEKLLKRKDICKITRIENV